MYSGIVMVQYANISRTAERCFREILVDCVRSFNIQNSHL